MATQKEINNVIHTLFYNIFIFEETYNNLLTTYTQQNTTKKEKNFITDCISKLNEIIEDKKSYNRVISGKSAEEIRVEILKEEIPNYRNIEDWIKAEIEKRKKHKSILKEERLLASFKLKFERLPIEKTLPFNLIENPHPRIFKNIEAFQIFEKFKENIKNPLADYSFIYRVMLKDDLIFESIGDSEYRRWLSSDYEIEIDKTKQLYICTTSIKERLYSTIKDAIQQ